MDSKLTSFQKSGTHERHLEDSATHCSRTTSKACSTFSVRNRDPHGRMRFGRCAPATGGCRSLQNRRGHTGAHPEHPSNCGFCCFGAESDLWGKKRDPQRLMEDNHPPCRRQDAKNMAGTDGHMEDSSRIRDHRRLLVWRGLFFLVLQSSFEGFLRLPLQAFVTNKA